VITVISLLAVRGEWNPRGPDQVSKFLKDGIGNLGFVMIERTRRFRREGGGVLEGLCEGGLSVRCVQPGAVLGRRPDSSAPPTARSDDPFGPSPTARARREAPTRRRATAPSHDDGSVRAALHGSPRRRAGDPGAIQCTCK
jgi:hypothetical protein